MKLSQTVDFAFDSLNTYFDPNFAEDITNKISKHLTPQIQTPFQKIQKSLESKKLSSDEFSEEEKKVIFRIAHCHTAEGGFLVEECANCGTKRIQFQGCKNRHCPVCQTTNKALWSEKRRSELVDAPYSHVVLTIPHELNSIILENKKECFKLIMKSATDTIVELSRDPKFLGATAGGFAILHTWNQHLNPHIHVHMVVANAGITQNKEIVRCKNSKFFLPTKVIADLFRGKVIAGLDLLRQSKELLKLTGVNRKYINYQTWKDFKKKLYEESTHWIAFLKETLAGSGDAVTYLANYTNSIAIKNSRIISTDDNTVTFLARCKNDQTKKEIVTLSHLEFVHRFCKHILPSGFQKVRYFGFLSNRIKSESLELFKKFQKGKPVHEFRFGNGTVPEIMEKAFGVDIRCCKKCKQPKMETVLYFQGYFPFFNIPKNRKNNKPIIINNRSSPCA